MDLYLVVLRIIHITLGVLWLGGAFFITLFVEPATKAAGAEGGKFMERLVRPKLERLGALGKEIAASGTPPTPSRLAEVHALQESAGQLSRLNAYIMIVILIAMSAARYL